MKKVLMMLLTMAAIVNGYSQCAIITSVAGTGTGWYSGEGGAADGAGLNWPMGVATDASGNVYIADYRNQRVRKVNTSGIITTVAGNGINGFAGDGGQATAARISYPRALAVDASGNLYISDAGNERIRKVTPAGIISTYAGNGSTGLSGDGGDATAASLNSVRGLAVDASGNLYLADCLNHRVRKVSPSGRIVTMPGSSDSVAATAISYGFPEGVAVDASGNLYISDFHMILKLLPSGNLDIIAGNGSWGYSGDGGMATAAELNSPTGLAFDASGNLFFAELGNNIIRRISPSGTITTVAGNGIAGFSGDRGHATAAKLNAPTAVAVDGSGNVYIADWLNEKVRKLTFSAMPTVTAIAGPASVALADTITLAATATPTGIWSSSHTGRALVSTGGAVTGIAVGSVTITFSATNTCGTVRTFKNISVYDPHVPLFPVGTPSLKAVCTGQFANIDPNLEVRDIDAGQTLTWSLLRAPRHGTANVTGSATATGGAVRPGGRTYTPAAGFTGRDTFTVRVTDGANTADLLMCMTVNASPAAPSISGPVQVCLNDSITLVGTPAGGMFNNTTGGVLCRPYGVVKGTAAGTSVITYTTPANALGCKATVTSAIAVKKLLSPVSITGATEVCTGSSITLNNDSTGGTWAVTNSTLATVSGGMVYGIAPGIDTVTYRYTNVCGTGIATRRITVNPSPDAGAITGPDTVLVGGFINLSRTTASAGVWSSSDNTIASVSAAGRVRGNSTGTDTIRYSVTNSCGTAIARKTITVIGFGGKAAGEATGTAIATTSIKVWPNPSEGTINLELPEAGATITVLDAAGRTVFAGTTTEAATAINLAELSAGTYILRVLCAGKVYAERVVIQ